VPDAWVEVVVVAADTLCLFLVEQDGRSLPLGILGFAVLVEHAVD
jgi:hypothetical protein